MNTMSDTQQDSSDIWNSSFYSSSSINSADHVKNFRNSLILNEISQDTEPAGELPDGCDSSIFHENAMPQNTQVIAQGPNSNGPHSSSKMSLEKSGNETITLNMSSSPSLSALAGILTEKSRQADRKIRSSMILENSIVEESSDEKSFEGEIIQNSISEQQSLEHIHASPNKLINKNIANLIDSSSPNLIGSPNLIDIHDDDRRSKFPGGANKNINKLIYEQPDFLSSPNPNGKNVLPLINKPSARPLISSKQSYSTTVPRVSSITTEQINGLSQPTQSQENDNSPSKSAYSQDTLIHSQGDSSTGRVIEQVPVIRNESTEESPVASNKIVGPSETKSTSSHHSTSKIPSRDSDKKKSIPTKSESKVTPIKRQEPITTPNKKKSIFSFLKKKSPKEKNSLSNGIPQSTTFSARSELNDTTPVKLTKKSHSSGSIFNNFKKNKEDKTSNTLDIKKTRSRTKSKSSNNAKILQRKSTPLDFEKELMHQNKEKITSDEETKSISRKASRNIDYLSTDKSLNNSIDTGLSLFPKSLDSHEVESIISLERSRSLKSKRNSSASQRKSLTESLSINAKNEGMFISEPTSVVLSTPDLTKSPASSILRSGRFPSGDNQSNILYFEDDDVDYTEYKQSKLIDSHANDFSFGSLEEQLNSLVIDSDPEMEGNTKINNSSTLLTETTPDDELMTDIMEFANIINFGDGLDFNFDISSKNEPQSIKHQNNTINLEDNSQSSIPVISIEDGCTNLEPTSYNYIQNIHETIEQEDAQFKHNFTGENEYQQSENDNFNEEKIEFDDEVFRSDFDNEDFNDLEELTEPSQNKHNAFLPESDNDCSRPISMSFKGLSNFQSDREDEISKSENTIFSDLATTNMSYVRPNSRLKFSNQIILYETYGEHEYDRTPDISACNQLTPQLAQMIKIELNELKSEMEIHEDSKCYTHFY
ncbi:hypothetical protein TPHA_0P01760 [Tetrapisispora phaffii CBS 4417]|uniref:Protein BNI4 n=1 Tax=Tetrapisispora phaffii (strain ATCC 24235 / CBS 4417 / NBRC 1672 / NRRL Y-8282 / UCD 70-5) TaxID=1071381 RepID=G8C2F5_TETPH|nr:hypothetical protein TPHA_0P01760 [Tetrapisispora phaffii CBS 4417]CCE66333.1 hypothetical protein TPHA_0P01760 [Tetrapisispora phaffii CBS 4417]